MKLFRFLFCLLWLTASVLGQSLGMYATSPASTNYNWQPTTNAALRALSGAQQLTSYASLPALNPDTGAQVVTVAFSGAPDLTYRAEATNPGYSWPLVATNATSGKFWVARPVSVDARWWGVKADGTTDDTVAWRALATWLNARNGNATVECPPNATSLVKHYIEGSRDDEYVIQFLNPVTNLVFNGNGMTLYDPSGHPDVNTNWVSVSAVQFAQNSGTNVIQYFLQPGIVASSLFTLNVTAPVGVGFTPYPFNPAGILTVRKMDTNMFEMLWPSQNATNQLPSVMGKVRNPDGGTVVKMVEFFAGGENVTFRDLTLKGDFDSTFSSCYRGHGLNGVQIRYYPIRNFTMERILGRGLSRVLSSRNITDYTDRLMIDGGDIDIDAKDCGYGMAINLAQNLRVRVNADNVRRGAYIAGATNVSVIAGVKNYHEAGVLIGASYYGGTTAAVGSANVTVQATDTGTVGPPLDGAAGIDAGGSIGEYSSAGSTRPVLSIAAYGSTLPVRMSNIRAQLYTKWEDNVGNGGLIGVGGSTFYSPTNSIGSLTYLFLLGDTGETTTVYDNIEISGLLDRSKAYRGQRSPWQNTWAHAPFKIQSGPTYSRVRLDGVRILNVVDSATVEYSRFTAQTWTNLTQATTGTLRNGWTVQDATSGTLGLVDQADGTYTLIQSYNGAWANSRTLKAYDHVTGDIWESLTTTSGKTTWAPSRSHLSYSLAGTVSGEVALESVTEQPATVATPTVTASGVVRAGPGTTLVKTNAYYSVTGVNSSTAPTSPLPWTTYSDGALVRVWDGVSWKLLGESSAKVTTQRTSVDDSTDILGGIGNMSSGWTTTGWTDLTGSFRFDGSSASGTLYNTAAIAALAVPGRTFTVTITTSGSPNITSGSTLAVVLGGTTIKTFTTATGLGTAFHGQTGSAGGTINFVATKNAGTIDVTIDSVTVTVHADGDWMHRMAYNAAMLVPSASAAPWVEISASGTLGANANAKNILIGMSDQTASTVPVAICTLATSANAKDWVLTGRLSALSSNKATFRGTLDANGETTVVDTAYDASLVGSFLWGSAGYIFIGANADGADADVTVNESSVEYKP